MQWNYYYSYLTNEDTKVQRDEMPQAWLHTSTWLLGIDHRPLGLKSHGLSTTSCCVLELKDRRSIFGKVRKLVFLRLVLFKSSGSQWRVTLYLSNIWKHLVTFLVLTSWGRECYWHLVDRSQGYCLAFTVHRTAPRWMSEWSCPKCQQ